jgi:hypothetical protein
LGPCRFIPAICLGRKSISSRNATGGTGFRLLVRPSAAFCICSAAAVSCARGLLASGWASPQAASKTIANGTAVQRGMETSEMLGHVG